MAKETIKALSTITESEHFYMEEINKQEFVLFR